MRLSPLFERKNCLSPVKTEPLKQWDVSREFRRRLQIVLSKAGIPLTPPQYIWLSNQSEFGIESSEFGVEEK